MSTRIQVLDSMLAFFEFISGFNQRYSFTGRQHARQ
uniref:Uncharacterized protein n=1 Tax=Setaria italica TaxID=4555 RepID=K3Y4H8_SETIT